MLKALADYRSEQKNNGQKPVPVIISSGVSKMEDIEKAVKNAEQFAAEDKKRREEVDAKNEAENLCYAVEKLLNESADKIDQADKDSLNEKVKALRETLNSGNLENIKSSTEALQKNMYDVSAKLYQSAAAAQQAAQAAQTATQDPNANNAPGNNQDGNVYDADFKDVDNK